MLVQVIALLCVVGLAVGQILFKLGANSLEQTGDFFTFKTATPLLSAMILYAAISIAWVWVLQKEEIGRVYPLMALAFILVPIASYFVFGERFQPQYFIGVALIIIGIIFVVRA